jgi:integrase
MPCYGVVIARYICFTHVLKSSDITTPYVNVRLVDLYCLRYNQFMQNTLTVTNLVGKYLTWCEAHTAKLTHVWYKGHLESFLANMRDADTLAALDLKPFHVSEWIDSRTTWGSTHKRGGIVAVQRVYNWAEEMGYVDHSPIKKLKKPPAERRETYMRPEDFDMLIDRLALGDPFRDLLTFVWYSGCRPQEARHIEPRHVDLGRECVVFPKEESKGKRYPRTIYLYGPALTIIQQLMAKPVEGKLFRNSRNVAWSKHAVCNRMNRLSEMTGKPMFLYAARHGFGTRKLKQGHDSITVSKLMGHCDPTMLSKVYSHIEKDDAFMKGALAE